MSIRLRSRLFPISLIGLLALAGCSPYRGSCSWIQPVEDQNLRVTAPRSTQASECNCIGCSAPGEFVLERPKYAIEIWNGDRWYPELAMRARAPDGSRLLIRSSRLLTLENSGPHLGRWKEFDYFLPVPSGPSSGRLAPLTIRVESPSGEVLGEETLDFELLVRTDYSIEFI